MGKLTDAIPTEQLELARRRLCANVANKIIEAMAESNTTFEQADKRLGHAPGFTKGYIINLITFDHGMMKEIAYIAEAMNCTVEIGIDRVIPERTNLSRHIPIEDIDSYVWLFNTRAEWDSLDPYTLVDVMDYNTRFHIAPVGTINPDMVSRWKIFNPFTEGENSGKADPYGKVTYQYRRKGEENWTDCSYGEFHSWSASPTSCEIRVCMTLPDGTVFIDGIRQYE